MKKWTVMQFEEMQHESFLLVEPWPLVLTSFVEHLAAVRSSLFD
jgi:hypothetical protein